MAQVLVDSQVMRDKSATLQQAATKIYNLYEEMLNEVVKMAQQMEGTTITTSRAQFEKMKNSFTEFQTDMNEYAEFLLSAAEAYEAAEEKGTKDAEQQGIF